MDIHIDMTEYMNNLSERLSKDIRHRAICEGDPKAMSKLEKQGSVRVTVDGYREAPLGQRQVESLLAFMVSKDTEKDLEDEEANNIIYEALGEHRILGRVKMSKRSRILPKE